MQKVKSVLWMSSKNLMLFCRDLCLILWSLKQIRIGKGMSAWIFPGGILEFRKGGQMVA